MEFKIHGKNEKVDLRSHIFQIKSLYPTLEIRVGCDSIAIGGYWHYVTVVAFRYGNSGAHFIYRKEKMPAIRTMDRKSKPDIFTRLWKEAEISINCAEYLKENGIYIDAIEMDYNTVPKWASNKLVGPTEGWAKSLGYVVIKKSSGFSAIRNSVIHDFENQYQVVKFLNCHFNQIAHGSIIDGWKIIYHQQIAVKAADHICKKIK